ncbi:MAG TPA: universal stress protein, partial [Thermoplasmata archaeon]|nr:universal stress protein [Thermoplasmata archaeon]
LVLFADLRVVATAAGLAFLLAFVLVNVALVRWRVLHPEVRRGFTAPLFPVFPALAIGANLVLALFLAVQPRDGQLAWTVIVLWLSVGLLLYYPFRGREEVRKPLPKRIDVAQLLAAEAPPVELAKYRVLVPLREFGNLPLVRLGAAIAAARKGELALLNVLEIPRSLPPKAIRFHYVDERIKGLRKLEKYARTLDADTRATVRIGHLPYEIVLRTIEEEDVNLLVLGWRGGRPGPELRILGDTIDYLVQRSPCDVVVARTAGMKDDLRSVLLYARFPEHATGAAELAAILASLSRATVTVLDIVEEGSDAPNGANALAATLRKAALDVSVKRVTAKNAVDAVVAESANHDLLVVGAGGRGAVFRAAFGPTEDDIAAKARCPVVLYRKGAPPASRP